MIQRLPREITPEEVNDYHRNGVIMLKDMFDSQWIELLKRGLAKNMNNPTHRARTWDRDAQGRTMFWDSQAWQSIDEYQEFIFNSAAAQLAGKLLRAKEVNFFFDAVFLRSPGSQFSTPWHQDEPYWSIEGYDTCTIWMPLVPVRKKNALALVPRSHLNNRIFDQYNFGNLNPDRHKDVDQVDFSLISEESIPDIDENREKYGVVSWDMQPGDCLVFNSRTLHGGSGKLDEDQELQVFTSKWAGDDVHIKFKDCGMDPDHSNIMTEYGLKSGDRLGTDLYPCFQCRVDG